MRGDISVFGSEKDREDNLSMELPFHNHGVVAPEATPIDAKQHLLPSWGVHGSLSYGYQ